jgi:hypothetical protein
MPDPRDERVNDAAEFEELDRIRFTPTDDEHDGFPQDAADDSRFSVQINETIVMSDRPNRRAAIIAALDTLPEELIFESGDTLTIVCTKMHPIAPSHTVEPGEE